MSATPYRSIVLPPLEPAVRRPFTARPFTAQAWLTFFVGVPFGGGLVVGLFVALT